MLRFLGVLENIKSKLILIHIIQFWNTFLSLFCIRTVLIFTLSEKIQMFGNYYFNYMKPPEDFSSQTKFQWSQKWKRCCQQTSGLKNKSFLNGFQKLKLGKKYVPNLTQNWQCLEDTKVFSVVGWKYNDQNFLTKDLKCNAEKKIFKVVFKHHFINRLK